MDCLLSLEWLSMMSTNQNMQSMFAGATSYRLRGLSCEWLMNILVSKSIQLCAVPAFLPIWTNGNFIHSIIILFVKLQWLRLKLSCNVGLVYRVEYANLSQTRPRYCQCKTWLTVLVLWLKSANLWHLIPRYNPTTRRRKWIWHSTQACHPVNGCPWCLNVASIPLSEKLLPP